MLAAWNGGDGHALDCLMEIVYPELRRVARQYLAGRRPGDSLESAALANGGLSQIGAFRWNPVRKQERAVNQRVAGSSNTRGANFAR
jgi:hypothetical protein